MKRNLILGGMTLLLLGLGVLGCILIGNAQSGTTAVITQNGQVLYRIDLTAAASPYTILLTGENGEENVILIEPNAVSMQSANCPDGLCVQRGRITGSGLPIVCLPNHIMIQIEEEPHGGSEIDAQVY